MSFANLLTTNIARQIPARMLYHKYSGCIHEKLIFNYFLTKAPAITRLPGKRKHTKEKNKTFARR